MDWENGCVFAARYVGCQVWFSILTSAVCIVVVEILSWWFVDVFNAEI